MLAVRKRRLERWVWATPVCLAGLIAPFFWPHVLLTAVTKRRFFRSAVAGLRQASHGSKALESQFVRSFLLLISLIAVSAA